MKYRQVVDMEKKKMKARKDRLDSRSSRRRLPFTILAQANVLLFNMNPIKMKLLIFAVLGPLWELEGHRFAGQTIAQCCHGRGSPGGGRLEGVGGGSGGREVKGLS